MASSLVQWGLYRSLRSHILASPTSQKAPGSNSSSPVALALKPLELFSASKPGKSDSHSPRSDVIRQFTRSFLSISNLPNRIPRTTLVQLVVGLPVVEVAESITQNHVKASDDVDLLANFVALAWKRIPHLPDGVSLKVYLLALTKLQDGIPPGVLRTFDNDSSTSIFGVDASATKWKGKGKVNAASNALDSATLARLQIIVSQDHLSALLTASAKHPTSTREALCAFLASSLQSWDSQTQEKILACVAYRYGGSATASSSAQSRAPSTHSIGGLVRELWRGWIRGSKLARGLSNEALQGRRALITILSDETLKSAWPCLIVLCHLYSRSLLTIGDDEFYPDEGRHATSTAGSNASGMRNPLTLDEVITLSGLLRNLAFAMYWFEGTGGPLNDLSHNSVVGMGKMDLLSLRDTVTRLLQQLHQRDSRRRFAPDNHWLMNSELDLNSFIQSVVMEEDELNKKQDEGLTDGGDTMDVEEDEVDEIDRDDEPMEEDENDASSADRPAISSRLANHRPLGSRKRGLTARSLAYLSPRLGVLNNIPFVIPFEVRVEIFHQFTALDYDRLRRSRAYNGPLRDITIRRGSVAEDGFTQLNGLGENLKHRIAIRFVDQFGIEESGIDGGGLFKEFLTSLIKEAFDTDRGLWSATDDQQLYPNPHSYAKQDDNLQWYKFLGRVLGKALYQGILVDINFASFFLSKWLGRGHGYLDDLSGLESLDKEVYRNLLWLKHYNGDVEKDLTLDFTVADEEFGEKRIHELVPNGRNIPVTRENRLEYIYRVSHYRLNEQIRQQSDAFLSGLTDLIDLRWLRMLNRDELRILISGTEGDIDLKDLQANTVLGGYHEKDQVMDFFWRSLESFTHAQRKAFLKFATSCPSPPLLGFQQLNPKFGIRHAGDDTSRLPTASTCVNLLKLPRYTSFEQCREKLLYAIESGAGFDLS
ncbi:HECT-domain-containing protein [Meira miltonrushii]|uniref:HECT-type E3 ubiquitin transferase n=1 Tax=Meira miltonrushii TaxID=1280837 RepID=A0A316V804_9BASI|nr:HECT-domain-containing protein [Meira miltonrushii]PWN33747.1 HECT-domain-containing protein [Meira miltonrushii]